MVVDSAESNELSCFGLNVLGHHLVETPHRGHHLDVDKATMDDWQRPNIDLFRSSSVRLSIPPIPPAARAARMFTVIMYCDGKRIQCPLIAAQKHTKTVTYLRQPVRQAEWNYPINLTQNNHIIPLLKGSGLQNASQVLAEIGYRLQNVVNSKTCKTSEQRYEHNLIQMILCLNWEPKNQSLWYRKPATARVPPFWNVQWEYVGCAASGKIGDVWHLCV